MDYGRNLPCTDLRSDSTQPHSFTGYNNRYSMEYPAEIIPGKLYFVCTQQHAGTTPQGLPPRSLCYWLDHDLMYEPFCADFGPCNLAHTWRFCQRVNHLLEQAKSRGQVAYLLVGPHPHKRANAAVLVGIHSVLFLGKRAEEAYAPIRPLEPFAGFRDASCGVPTYTLGVADVIRGMYRAKEVGFINWHLGEEFNIDEYEHYEQVENGDLNWIVPGKLIAFAGPSAQPKHFGGWRTFTPEDYISYFSEKKVNAVIRLNKKMYEAARFTSNGVSHHDLYFPDGTCPSEPILYRFLDLVERESGAVAVHCKAGLGRTGVLICSYMIKHYGFTAEEAMGYIRICRPGSVIGPQQHYLMQYAPRLLHEGRMMRQHLAAMASKAAPAAGNPHNDTDARPAQPSLSAQQSDNKRVIDIIATSRSVDILAHQEQSSIRQSQRLAASTSPKSSTSSARITPARTSSSIQMDSEPNHIVSVPERHLPPASPNKPAHARGAPVYIHVEAQEEVKKVALTYTPPRQPSRAAMPSLANSPSGLSRAHSQSSGDIGTPTTTKASVIPPSSTKRVLAPNGQPRKIPMAMDFNQVDTAALEDRDMHDDVSMHMVNDDDGWTVSSQPVHDKNYSSGSRVGSFAAAAGRGATAFVEAFRSAMGAHRTSYSNR